MVLTILPTEADKDKSAVAAAAFRASWRKMMAAMDAWIEHDEPRPDVIIAEMEVTLEGIRQIKDYGVVRQQ